LRKSSLEIHNLWAGYLGSPGFGELLASAGKGAGRVIKSEVVIKCSVVGTVTHPELVEFVSNDALSVGLTWRGACVAVSPSVFLCSKILNAAAGSGRISVYTCFQKAAFELFLMNVASAIEPRIRGVRVNRDIDIVKMVPSSDKHFYARIAVDFYTNEFIGSAEIYPIGIESRIKLHGNGFENNPLKGRILLSTLSLTPEVLGVLVPGDIVNAGIPNGRCDGALAIFNDDEKQMECPIQFSNFGVDKLIITGNFKEVKIMEVEMEKVSDSGEIKKGMRIERMRLPVRFEVGSVTISPEQFLALSPGQVLHVDEGGMMQAKMMVCGTTFAKGKIERFEDFYGFRIERLC